MGGTQDVFAQLAAEQAANAAPAPISATPPGGGDIFAQIHAANQQGTAPTGNAGTAERPLITPLPGESFQDTMNRAVAMGKQVTPAQVADARQAGLQDSKQMAIAAGSVIAPEIAPELAEGSWLAKLSDSWLGHALMSGLGGAVGTSAGQAAAGQNPASAASLSETGRNAVSLGLSDALFGAIPAIAEAKLGRSFVNESLGANPADVIYGNPAKAIEREGITSPITGDIEKVKAAGNDLTAAGGRLGQVAQRVQQLQPQLNQALSGSSATISVASAIDKPLTDAMNDVIDNSAMTDAEKMAAITQLGGLQSALHEGMGSDISPLQANQLKNLLGSRVRWNGTNAIGDEVKPAYKAVYASLKNAVNDAVPGVADLNGRLTDLYAAQDDLLQLARREEVGRGMGMMRGTIGTSMIGRVEGELGRVLPSTAAASTAAQPASKFAIPALLGSSDNPDIHVTNLPALLGGQQ